jgi:hypothetical protein
MQCEEWADANSELFKEVHDEAVHKNSYKRKLYELISASLTFGNTAGHGYGSNRQRPLNSYWQKAPEYDMIKKYLIAGVVHR